MTASRKLMLLAISVVIGCTPSTSAKSGGPGPDSRTLKLEEIERSQMSGTAYDVISRLRPSFLTGRGEVTVMGTAESKFPSVYLDGVLYGDINSLRNLDGSHIAEVRMYQAWEAQTKFGTGNNSGVIAITTRR
jgi:hypothetical protein